jgi:hypothetical protein
VLENGWINFEKMSMLVRGNTFSLALSLSH